MNDPKDSLIEYPCDFPIKVMCVADDNLVATMAALVQQYDPAFEPDTITTRASAKGNYLSLTVLVRATSREQLDNIYRAFSSHPLVKMVL
ncbi:MAG: hypothetical protein RL748_4518 [Pseudomonadota bacterium]|jgi:putative lipoic acid-binding regulatory protein